MRRAFIGIGIALMLGGVGYLVAGELKASRAASVTAPVMAPTVPAAATPPVAPVPARAARRAPAPPQSVDPRVEAAERAPLPASWDDFPQTADVQRGIRKLLARDRFGFGPQFWTEYMAVMRDLQRCAEGRIGTRGHVEIKAQWTLTDVNGKGLAELASVEQTGDATLAPDDVATILECLRRGYGRQWEMAESARGQDGLTVYWDIAYPWRESAFYAGIISGDPK